MDTDSKRFDPPDQSLGRSVGRGAVVTGGAQIVKLGCQIISVIALSRLLQPEDFGIVAMAAPVIAFVGLFQDLGLTQATVQKKGITHSEVNSLFWINMGVSTLLGVVMILIAPLVARFYSQPQVAPLVAAMSLQLVILGSGAQHFALVTRRMEFGRLAVLESVAAVLGLAVAIGWAMIWHTYWALFIGGLTTMAITTLGCWLTSRWLPGLPRWVSGTGGMVSFGAGITGFNFANYFARNLDQILIGRRWGNQELGLYDRANRLLLFPLQQITNPLGRVMIPALSRIVDEPHRYRRAYLRVVPLLLFVALPGVAVAIGAADLLIPLALGEQWHGTVTIFQALGFAGLLQPLNNPSGWLFISQGRSMEFMRWGIFGAATTAAALLLGLPYGAFGVAMAYAISEYVRTPLLWLYIGRKGPVQPRHILRTALPFVLGAHISVAVLCTIKQHLPGDPAVVLVLATLLSYAIVAGVAALFPAGRETLADVCSMARNALSGPIRRMRA
ncbi:lipopolysaccharide biosynthesis protein [Falsirhodobacter sp. 20TX0035]|uniref:lipopolysaccharide biosynthesis protein n=1 Tax=Falsirhodobacter sp. 20TX0035 TaxID=3022019 RepID=UPI00232C60E2|nr:lipopolysaccharide biosynthesis protein [Falsirhodobacter sp. 20TX0035]MDB6454789.1 lipopolysaccharide biosynthesis protein [Falsirhodobacter sp. 20TX0035]